MKNYKLYFDEDGYSKDSLDAKLKENKSLEGDEALAYLSDIFANCTHGNYEGLTFFLRLNENFKVKIYID